MGSQRSSLVRRAWVDLGRKTLIPLCIIAFAGCANGGGAAGVGSERISRSVKVVETRSDFHQSLRIASDSLRLLVDKRGYRWPVGTTLNVWGWKSVVDPHTRYGVEIRNDHLQDGSDLKAAYAYLDTYRDKIKNECREVRMLVDGEPWVRPIKSVSASIYTDKACMPVITDANPDVLELIVENNPPDPLVISAKFGIELQPADFSRLAAAEEIQYEVCAEVNEATPDEIKGLKQVYEWVQSVARE